MSTIGPYSYDASILEKALEGKKGGKVLVQLPDGVKRFASEAMYHLEPYLMNVHIWGGTCFGACDFPNLCEYDLLIQFGHAPIPGVGNEKTVFIPLRRRIIDDSELVMALANTFGDERPSITLVSTIETTHDLDRLADVLHSHKYQCVVPDVIERSYEKGQVLGCNAGHLDIKTDIAIFIGDGRFHPLGIALSNPDIRIFTFKIGNTKLKELTQDAERVVRIRWAIMENAKKCSRFGVITTMREGQNRVAQAEEALLKLREHGKEAEILMTEIVDIASLLDWDFDAYVVTVCPRLALDDSNRFHVPVITLQEMHMILDGASSSSYTFDTLS
ncbi:MAG TPA: diphthamide biosynthesis enzyme Dph2 [Euryarchaeota archaeon]|nr:diphthamide biosynthesis enzyme Dph2 [Euryarchaeota archaeon]